MNLFTAISLVCTIFVFTDALYGPKSDVILLSSKNFDQEIMSSNHVWIVEFFAPWCGHCKQLAPIWEQAAKKLKGIVKIAAVDADADKQLGGRFGVQGFPTLKVFGSPVSASKPQKTKSATDYNGGRTLKDITNYALSLLPTKQITKISSKQNFDDFLAKADEGSLPKVILFTEKATSPPLFSSLSLEFHGKVSFGLVKKGSLSEEVLTELGVSNFPTVVLIPSTTSEKKDVVKFDGELKSDLLIKFVTQNSGVVGESQAEKKTEKKPAKGKTEQKDKKQEQQQDEPQQEQEQQQQQKRQREPEVKEPAEVHEINSESDIETHCVTKKHLCVLAFLDPLSDSSSHQNYLATLKEVAEKYQQQLNVVWVDIAKQPDFSSHFNCLEIPTLRVWSKSKNAAVSVVASITTKSISQFLDNVLSGKVKTSIIPAPPAIVEGGVKLELFEEELDSDSAQKVESGHSTEL